MSSVGSTWWLLRVIRGDALAERVRASGKKLSQLLNDGDLTLVTSDMTVAEGVSNHVTEEECREAFAAAVACYPQEDFRVTMFVQGVP